MVGRWRYIVRKPFLPKCPIVTNHPPVLRPMNTSSTAKDLAQAFDVSRPTHIGVYPAYLKTVQEAIRSTDLAKEGNAPKLFTILERAKGLPNVSTNRRIFNQQRRF